MAVQIHTYLSPSDEPGEEVIDKAVWVCKYPNIQREGDKLVAFPVGDVYKSRKKYRSGRTPEELDVDPISRFCPETGAPAMSVNRIELTLGNNVPDPLRQIDAVILAKILTVTSQAGSVVVND
jgi:hypothetical protein